MRNLYILVVLYRKKAAECVSLRTLLPLAEAFRRRGGEADLLLWNNSPPQFDLGPLPAGVELMGDGTNHTLPQVYNGVARYAASRSGKFLLLLADDDSDFSGLTPDTLWSAAAEAGGGRYGLLLPTVYSSGELVSPARRIWFKGVRARAMETGEVSSRNLLAINSGMMIYSECIAALPFFFDERLRYYGTDTDFMVRYERLYSHVRVLPDCVGHSLSEHGQEERERLLFRWRDHFHGLRITFGSGVCSRGIVNCYILYLKLKLALKHRCLDFLS